VPAPEAAAAGAWLHARAAAAGPAEGLVAGDVVSRLPDALAEVVR
jgi:NAD(P)H-hydrate repair Nnr-like enzyme with NAD(P)H-hydrate dehydratase domain